MAKRDSKGGWRLQLRKLASRLVATRESQRPQSPDLTGLQVAEEQGREEWKPCSHRQHAAFCSQKPGKLINSRGREIDWKVLENSLQEK